MAALLLVNFIIMSPAISTKDGQSAQQQTEKLLGQIDQMIL